MHLYAANLDNVVLFQAGLYAANLREACLEGADFSGANLQGAILRKAFDLTIEQLSKVNTLFEANLDSELLDEIKKKYPHLLEEPEEV